MELGVCLFLSDFVESSGAYAPKKKKKDKDKIILFIVATNPVSRPNADRLERRTLVPINKKNNCDLKFEK